MRTDMLKAARGKKTLLRSGTKPSTLLTDCYNTNSPRETTYLDVPDADGIIILSLKRRDRNCGMNLVSDTDE
jgi:hypothetical protein